MKIYAIQTDSTNRINRWEFTKYVRSEQLDQYILVDHIPEGNLPDYLYVNGEYVYDPIPKVEVKPEPTAQDDTDAMMVDHEYRLTLLELGIT